MNKEIKNKVPISDYSLVGKDAALAVQRGLTSAKWYTSPVPREKMRELLKRRNGPAIRDTLLWFALLFAAGACGYLLWGSLWAVIPFAIYGVLYASVSDSRWHESSHGTAFKTDWMNNALYEIASFMVLRESVPWRWSHTRHHSDTIIVGRDPEIAVQRPVNLRIVFANFLNLMALRMYVRNVFLHSIGRLNPEEITYIPETERAKVFARARIYVLVYASVIALSIYTGSILPLMFIGLSSIYGVWLMPIYGYTQHAGLAENVLDHRLNCRTVYMNPINRFLYWNMGYHIEHHMFPLVPYHALPKLHELVKSDMPVPYRGLLDAYREIIPALLRQAKDSTYFVNRDIPISTSTTESVGATPIFTSEGQAVVDGWIEVCEGDFLPEEDVLRFDHAQATFAIYRSDDGSLYATDGVCTHGNTHLAEGMVKGDIIECAKHNGRFDIRDGSPQRQPVCVGLKTFAVRERSGKIWINLDSAAGDSAVQEYTTYRFRVVSNINVTPFIKELVLEVDKGSPHLQYQPGDYLQFDIPVYEERSLGGCQIQHPYDQIWKDQQIYKFRAANSIHIRRNYSLASNPYNDEHLRFNVRLASPPLGLSCNAGRGSSYIFSLKTDDTITAIGPFGEFHIKETGREMVYLGGGAGMAPLRSHLSTLFETRHTSCRVSYWYGARSLQDLFYQDYFEELSQKNENFSFHVALSEAQPEDGWDSYTGFIHEVLKREYLDSHRDPTEIEYFLCGPPVMIQAASKMLSDLGVNQNQISYDEF
jgi:Na+-transporting NADH:ubiquinone oxidoreductase subunit F